MLAANKEMQTEKWKGHEATHELIALALKNAADTNDERLSRMNEWRATVGDLVTTYMTRDQFAAERRTLQSDMRQNMFLAVAIASLIVGAIALVLRAYGV